MKDMAEDTNSVGKKTNSYSYQTSNFDLVVHLKAVMSCQFLKSMVVTLYSSEPF